MLFEFDWLWFARVLAPTAFKFWPKVLRLEIRFDFNDEAGSEVSSLLEIL